LAVVAIFLMIVGMAAVAWWRVRGSNDESQFAQLMTSGRSYYASGNPQKAIELFQQALAMNPANPDVHLNLANAFLLANQPAQSLVHSLEAQQLEAGNPAGFYLAGCAYLHQNNYSNAVQALSIAKQIDRTINSVSFQLGLAYAGLAKWQDAATELAEVVEFEKDHPSAHYQLSQIYLRQGLRDDAQRELAEHQRINAKRPQTATDPRQFEICKYTEIRTPTVLEQPSASGIEVRFVDATAIAFPGSAAQFRGPVGIFDINQRGWNDILVADTNHALSLLWNSNGVFEFRGTALPSIAGKPSTILVGDLQNDHYEDALVLGDSGAQVIRFGTNGAMYDATAISGLRGTRARAGVLADFDVIGKLGLMTASAEDGTVRTYSAFANLGTMTASPAVFRERKPADGAQPIRGVIQITIDDWNNDDMMDAVLTRAGQPPLLLLNHGAADGLQPSTNPPAWPAAKWVALGDLNNDLRTDIALLTEDAIEVYFGGLKEPERIPAKQNRLRQLRFLDYDNDGWLDVIAWGDEGVRIWRNRGARGFHEMTAALGIPQFGAPVVGVAAADFDKDCDTDLIVDLGEAGLRYLRNDGANANGLLKLRPIGNRSNASGLGLRLQLDTGTWRTVRTVTSLPVEIGVGKRAKVEAVTARWFDNQLIDTDVTLAPCETRPVIEITTQNTGSCPYLYAWDGGHFRFVTDILGAAPLGLPAREGVYIQDDPEEFVRIGDEREFPLKDGKYVLQVTEELREALYLDYARLVAVDHPPGIEVQPTSKLLPHPPYAHHGVAALKNRLPLVKATRLDGTDVTAELAARDGRKASPPALLGTQVRGTAMPHGYILDFGPIAASKHWVLALNGWLRYGGGMGNIAAAHILDGAYPFPTLEASADGSGWKPVAVEPGAPAGKTKTILIDLNGKLPEGSRYFRLKESFDLYWDTVELWEAAESTATIQTVLEASRSDLHWRGYSVNADLPFDEPLTPQYDRVVQTPWWRITPSGWATRYGDVGPLIHDKDNGLAIVAGGDELTLEFSPNQLPPKPDGMVRTFFFWSMGWDKDSDYHVVTGDRIDPLPWHGLDAQRYGAEVRPPFASDALHRQFNTRWIGPRALTRANQRPADRSR
jgi:tetratricopeptide (TPR) repeat protein